jgi:hemoglobin-like flavoprotein
MTPSASPPTAAQRRLVRDSFELIRPQLRPVALLFYGKLFELDPSARRLFHIDLAVQSRKIMDTLDSIADSLDRLETMEGRLAELGRQHANYGVRPEQYDTVMTALLWTFAQALGSDFDAATREAWTHALESVCAIMKRGALSSDAAR